MKASTGNCFHLTVEIVREIHSEAIVRYGGAEGVRESSLLESAVAAPQASVGGKSPYAGLAGVAAAYLFYLCKNHLRLNGIEPKPDRLEWEELTLAVAAGRFDRAQTTARLRALLP